MTIQAAVSVKFTDSAAIDKAIASIKSRGAKLDADPDGECEHTIVSVHIHHDWELIK